MKSEKLQCLLYSFLKNRQECDIVDRPVWESQHSSTVVDRPVWEPQRSSTVVDRPVWELQCSSAVVHLPELESLYSSAAVSGRSWIPQCAEEFHAEASFEPLPWLIHLFPFGSITPSPEIAATGRRLSELADVFSLSKPEESIVKFKDVCIVKEPKEQLISIPVYLSHSFFDQEIKVSWETCDKTALAGTHYAFSSGELVFNKGDTQKAIDIQILNSSDDVNDLRFTVKLHHVGGLFDPTPLTISLEKINMLYGNEKQVLNNLLGSRPLSVSDIRSTLEHCLNSRTFHMALTHLCSYGSTTDHQLALAFELTSLCARKLPGLWSQTLPRESILYVLEDFFRMDE